ncbi:hypothetical protein KIN20_006253 [Parelaphostrongylus tenuis]|uniref:WH2 domain-containing protein n=1 Tax=Parelaphostrongylus tenuis TaxID=148309 RepID=A0AAD5M1H6_PARTN|nr:hypothetical protein KIN20_006253 [Parelaphostrongylus tenuis]
MTPNADSNIRKVKEAVRQSLGQKSANALLLQAHLSTVDSKDSQSDVKRSELNGTASTGSRKHLEIHMNGHIASNKSKVFKEQFPSLKKVEVPIEKNGITLGRGTIRLTAAERPIHVERPIPPPPPPPPPPTVLLSSSSLSPPMSAARPSTSLISTQDLEDQKTKLKPTAAIEKSVIPMDVRGCLMAEIRNAGGLQALRPTLAQKN